MVCACSSLAYPTLPIHAATAAAEGSDHSSSSQSVAAAAMAYHWTHLPMRWTFRHRAVLASEKPFPHRSIHELLMRLTPTDRTAHLLPLHLKGVVGVACTIVEETHDIVLEELF